MSYGLILDVPSWDTVSSALDADAASWIDRINSGDRILTASEKTALNKLTLRGKSKGWWSGLIDFGFLCWGDATADRQSALSSNLITFNGTRTHNNLSGVAFGADGYAHLAYTANVIDSNNSGMGVGKKTATSASNRVDIGWHAPGAARSSLASDFAILSNSYGNTAISNGTPGIVTIKRNTSSGSIVRTNGGGSTQLLGGTPFGSYFSPYSIPVYLGAEYNANLGGPGAFSAQEYYLWVLMGNLNDTQRDDMHDDFWSCLLDLEVVS